MSQERVGRLLALGVAAVVLSCALPAVAGAADYCVDPITSCAGPNNVQDLEDALAEAAAAPGADRILLGTRTYTAQATSGYFYSAASSPVQIVGQGVGKTVLTAPAGAHEVLSLSGGPGTVVSDLTIIGEQNAPSGFMGLWTNNTARRIQVIEQPIQMTDVRWGVYLDGGGTLEDSTVTLGTALATTGVFVTDGHVRHSVVSARTGIASNHGTIERSQVTGKETGVKAYAGVTSITSSRVAFTDATGTGIGSYSYAGVDHSSLSADGVTIVGPGGAGTKGAVASTAYDSAWGADLALRNSIIRGASTSLAATAPGTGQAKITASYSDYDPASKSTSSAKATIAQANISNTGNAGFVDAAGGNYHLLPGSPLVDAGDPATAQGLDLDGNPLVADGNGDGTPRRDVGAFELPAGSVPGAGGPAADTHAPLVSGFRATPSLFAIARRATPVAARVRRGTRFRYTLDEAAHVRLKVQRALPGRRAGGRCVRPTARLRRAKRCTRYRPIGVLSRSAKSGVNVTRFSGRLRKRALRPGRYRARITAIDTAGNRSAPRSARFRVARA